MMNYFSFAQIETISPRPILMIVNERAVSAYFSEEAYSKAAEMLGGAMFAGKRAIIRALMRASKLV